VDLRRQNLKKNRLSSIQFYIPNGYKFQFLIIMHLLLFNDAIPVRAASIVG
jgi:hypothetical protein